MITLHIEAESISDLKTKIDKAVAGLYESEAQDVAAHKVTAKAEPKTLKEKFRNKKRDAVIKETAELIVDKALGEDELKTVAKKAKTKTKKPQATSAITVDKLREALQKVSSAKGLVEAKAILDSFDCPKISELEEKDHAAFIKKCEQSV